MERDSEEVGLRAHNMDDSSLSFFFTLYGPGVHIVHELRSLWPNKVKETWMSFTLILLLNNNYYWPPPKPKHKSASHVLGFGGQYKIIIIQELRTNVFVRFALEPTSL